MSDTDLTWRREPTRLDLRDLERIGDSRAEIEAVEATGEGDREVRRLLLDVLDEMEEGLCLYGRRAPVVREGWRRLACFDSFGRNGNGNDGGN